MLDTLRPKVVKLTTDTRELVTRTVDGIEDMSDVTDRVRSVREIVTPLGWTVAAIGIVSWILGWQLGWLELMIVAGSCLLLVLAGLAFVVGRSTLHISLALDPPRVTAGDPSAGQVVVANPSGSRRTAPARVEVPVGAGVAVFDLPSLAGGSSAEELFVISTERRGVIPVGPATSVRGDPLGLFQRKASGSRATELMVHPHTVPLAPFGSGLLRDLEGLTTKDLSSADLAFHALREYEPGDDRRHVHWRSSAKAGKLLVRQYLDTRRSTLCVLVDGQESGYADPGEFELALEVAGSVARRACRDGLPAVLVAGSQVASGVVPHVLLDALSRAELERKAPELTLQAGRAVARGADISVAVIVSGSLRTPQELDKAAMRFPPDVRIVGMRVVPHQVPYVTVTPRGVVTQIGALMQLPALLSKEIAA